MVSKMTTATQASPPPPPTDTSMAPDSTTTIKKAHMHTIPNEIVENIVENIPKGDLDTLRSFRLVCRNVEPVATKLYAEKRFKELRVTPTKSTVHAATKFFANTIFGEAVRDVVLCFHGSHHAAHKLHDIQYEKDFISGQSKEKALGINVYRKVLAKNKAETQATYDEDCTKIDVPGMLALFPNMIYLQIWNLNQVNLPSKFPLLPLAAAIMRAGTKLKTLKLTGCQVTADSFRQLLAIFSTIDGLLTNGNFDLINDWASVFYNIIVHGKSLKSLQLDTGRKLGPASRFSPEDVSLGTCREFQKTFRTFQSYRISPTGVEASGALAIKHACERIGKHLVGDEPFGEMMRKCEKEAEVGVASLQGSVSV